VWRSFFAKCSLESVWSELQSVIEQGNDQNDQQKQSQPAARIVTPTATVWPSWEGTKRQYKKYD
jgi:hypothetical protein